MKRHYLRLVRRAMRGLRHPRLRHREWWKRLSAPLRQRHFWVPCRDSVAIGLSAGLFFSMIPIPFQMVPAAVVSGRFHGNIPLAMAACWLTNPLTQVPIMWSQFRLGQALREFLHIPIPHFFAGANLNLPGVGILNPTDFVLGFTTMAVVCALAAFPLVHLFSYLLPHYLPKLRHRRKLRHKPATAE
ncbi:MAG: DUF2062 domain-containing protein [Verrucomicrobia bacterium]|nr:DUF2062 domain-containing protein [Verrucomicrobiota bacterium]